MKSLSRFSTLLNRSKSVSAPPSTSTSNVPAPNFDNAPTDSPEASVGRTIRLFCESGSMSNGGEEVLHLPAIVEAAESSPNAAAAAAQQIRKFLTKEWATKPYVQYNAIMLIRILSDNPGPSFTRNFDKTFVNTIKEALRNCKDMSTQQILRETLDSLEANKQYQEGMELMIQMWRKEKGQSARIGPGIYTNRQLGQPGGMPAPFDYQYGQLHSGQQGEQYRSTSGRRQLPPPIELASRIEEARNTAKILLQLIQSTPSEEVLNNDLIKEFADRCQSAQKSMQGYISCDSPPPDDDTMLTLIETNEQLSLASTRYQRSVLAARRALGISPSPNAETTMDSVGGPYAPPPGSPAQSESLFAPSSPPRQAINPTGFANSEQSYQPPPGPPRQSTMQNNFSNRDEVYQPPTGPPRQTSQPTLFAAPDNAYQPTFGPPRQITQQSRSSNGDQSYQPPPGPPPAMLARLNSREGQSPNPSDPTYSPPRSPPQSPPPRSPRRAQVGSDPFADPVEHDRNAAPYAVASTNNSALPSNPANRPHSQTFSIDAEPTYAPPPGPPQQSPTDQPDSAVSSAQSSDRYSSAMPPRRPAPGAYHQSGNTASYIGRQTDAANGLTMRGAQRDSYVPEIDGHSEVGRTDSSAFDRSNTVASEASSAYSTTPTETRAPQGGIR